MRYMTVTYRYHAFTETLPVLSRDKKIMYKQHVKNFRTRGTRIVKYLMT